MKAAPFVAAMVGTWASALLAHIHTQPGSEFDQSCASFLGGLLAFIVAMYCFAAIRAIIREELERKDGRER